MPKVLLTGSAGFIGYHVFKRLQKMGIDVLGVDNLNNYYDVNLKLGRLQDCGFDLEEILLIRAAFAILSKPAMADEWNAIDAKLRKQVADALATEANGKPVIYTEEN